jgi:hypothetical protein
VRRWPFALLTALLVSCSRPAPDATPEGVLHEWIDRMNAQVTDPHEAPAAYALLSKATHAELEKRAERASLIEGHRASGYEMLASGRFSLRFAPKHYATTITGDTATVVVTGVDPTEHATVRCVKEGRVWRVDLALPELTELPRRPDAP